MDFLDFVGNAARAGFIPRGHFLIFDNAGVHQSNDIFNALDQLSEQYGFRIVPMPKYSPELSPCELVFGYVKNRYVSLRFQPYSRRLRKYWCRDPLWVEVIRFMSEVSPQMVNNFYRKCDILTAAKAQLIADDIRAQSDATSTLR